jgi:Tetratricopeptide repeat.
MKKVWVWLAAIVCPLAISARAWSENAVAANPISATSSAEAAAAAPGVDRFGYFQKGNQAYLDGDYPKAIGEYRRVLEIGVVHPDLYFNLGNAYYRAGQKGLAVLFYEKALDLDPSDSAASSNLVMVQKELIDRVVMPEGGPVGEPLWHGFIRGLSVGWLTGVFLVLYGISFGILIWRRLVSGSLLRRLLFWFSIPLLCLALSFGVLLGSRIYVQEVVHHGVVVSQAAGLREGPDRNAKMLMELHEGLKFQLLSEVGDYARVRLQNGVEGFLLRDQFGKI